MSELSATWWNGYGKPKVFVERPDGSRVGFWDLGKDEGHPDDPADYEALAIRVQQWKSENPDKTTGVASAQRRGHSRTQEVTDRRGSQPGYELWTDLAANSAGAEARKRAREMRADSWPRALWDRLRGANKDERNWRIGADGEKVVGDLLRGVARRDSRWRDPLNAVVYGKRGSDIDQVLIGSGGVFAINVKHHPGKEVRTTRDKVLVEGWNGRYVEKSRHEATTASRLLSTACGFTVHVEAMLVFVGVKRVTLGPPIDGIHIVEYGDLARWVRERNSVYSDGIVQSVYDAARRSTVWRPPQAP